VSFAHDHPPSLPAHAWSYKIIPNSITAIGDLAFTITGLTSVVMPDSVTSFGTAFNGCCDITRCDLLPGTSFSHTRASPRGRTPHTHTHTHARTHTHTLTKRERESVCVCVCVCERERECVCVCVREREREIERERERVCVCVSERV
jgi:hypothetical protein